MKKIDQFTNCYPLSKTLRFSLIPVGETETHFNQKLLLEEDEQRAKSYVKVKACIDKYHKHYIDEVLSATVLNDLQAYTALYYKSGKGDSEKKQMEKAEANLRKQIADALTKTPKYAAMFKADMIKALLPAFQLDDEEKLAVEEFYSFATYFTGFFENRKNMYSSEAKATAISYRCVNENLPKFLDNAKSFKTIQAAISQDVFDTLTHDFLGIFGVQVEDIFTADYFSFTLSQSGIQQYNAILGGYTCEDGTKIQGLNEYINLYNQQVAKKDKSIRLPKLKMLYKQILSDSESISYIPEKFTSDDEVFQSVNNFYVNFISSQKSHKLMELFSNLDSYRLDAIYVSNGSAITTLSQAVFQSWRAVSDGWNLEYASAHPLKKSTDIEKYEEKRHKAYKGIASFSLAQLQYYGDLGNSGDNSGSVVQYIKSTIEQILDEIQNHYNQAATLLTTPYTAQKKLCVNDEAIALVKNVLDSMKQLEYLLKSLCGSGKEEDKDDLFYGEFSAILDSLLVLDKLYDKVRNYVTQKPYSKDKIKLNFQNPQLLGGWDKNKERDYRTVLLRKNGLYYLAIMDKTNSQAFVDSPHSDNSDNYEKMEYKLLPGPNKMLPKVFFADSNLETFQPPAHIVDIRKRESFKKGDTFRLNDCHTFIDFFKQSIERHEDWRNFGFQFSPTESYSDISQFYNEVKQQGYSVHFKDIPSAYIDSLISAGHLYLFQIYNKDFSPHSKGTPNLHTLYFKMLFDECNLKDVVYQLNGGAEMFYRKASISRQEAIVHPANQPIQNKNPNNEKPESLFTYDIIKDKRFTKRQFSLHIPITLNFKASGIFNTNLAVRKVLKDSDDTVVIGIDRGERNLLYICAINGHGEILEQISLNQIIGDKGHTVDYHKLLDRKETERKQARQNWGAIENIKELKEGYLSQVVHTICQLVIKYDAVVAMEDLNSGFKNSRFKVEKQVYQKFEKMLTDKLRYLADKQCDPVEMGGLLHAYQLTNKEPRNGMQDGFIFYVPAWLTSKIDPTTGFVDLLHPKYTAVSAAKAFFTTFDCIGYNTEDDLFEFNLDYAKFPRGSQDFKQKWTVCTYGQRIHTFRNPQKNNEYDNQIVELTDTFKTLFAQYQVPLSADMSQDICKREEKEFFFQLTHLLKLTLQMRNSITGNIDVDYLISPVRNSTGEFYDSRTCSGTLPANADANGAYHIARKALWAIESLKETADEELPKAKLAITNKDWLKYTQGGL
ncbi:type V CRISPR-associated protein Cas12a/Cpf1 [Bengtsoniella intestinalis]|uniref:type V CRISPR-associated protein Cas12a/Cpf1 n=1 Tax=Bengtsoniella intestinalis TaxID=3073143 RepID=UPI00391F3C9E